jgi:hypothetical protein
MNSNQSIHKREEAGYSGGYIIIPVIGSLLIIVMLMYLNSDSFTLPGIIPWPDSAIGKVIALVGQYILIFLPILLLCAGVLVLTALAPGFRPIYLEVRKDWSLVSYLLYGLSIFMIVLNDEYRGLGSYKLASLIILFIGAFLYLSPAGPWLRLLKLIIALKLAMIVLGLGIYQIYPQQSWAAHTTFPRWWEAIWPFLIGISLSINMTLPSVLGCLPKDSEGKL